MEQLQDVSQHLVLLCSLRWSLVSPRLDQNRQLVIGSIDLNPDPIVEENPAGLEHDAKALAQQLEHDSFGNTLFAAVSCGHRITVTQRIDHRPCSVRATSRRFQVVGIAAEVVDDLARRADIAAQPTSALQPTTHLIDRLPRPHIQPMCELVVIKCNSAPPQLIQYANSDSRLSHMDEIADHVRAVTTPLSAHHAAEECVRRLVWVQDGVAPLLAGLDAPLDVKRSIVGWCAVVFGR